MPQILDKKTDRQKEVEAKLSQPPITSLLNHLKSTYSTDPFSRVGIDAAGMRLSGLPGPAHLVGRAIAEGPMYHDELLTAARQLTPKVSPRYRTNKVGEQVLLGVGNFVKDSLSGMIPKIVTSNFGPVAGGVAATALPYLNLVTDGPMYGKLYELADYMQKGRSELDGKSIFQSIPGFEDWLTDISKNNIADQPNVRDATKILDSYENSPYQLDENAIVYQLMKLFKPDMIPYSEVDKNGKLIPKPNKASFLEPAIDGDFNYKTPGFSTAQQQGANLMNTAQKITDAKSKFWGSSAGQAIVSGAKRYEDKGLPGALLPDLIPNKDIPKYLPRIKPMDTTKRNSLGQRQEP